MSVGRLLFQQLNVQCPARSGPPFPAPPFCGVEVMLAMAARSCYPVRRSRHLPHASWRRSLVLPPRPQVDSSQCQPWYPSSPHVRRNSVSVAPGMGQVTVTPVSFNSARKANENESSRAGAMPIAVHRPTPGYLRFTRRTARSTVCSAASASHQPSSSSSRPRSRATATKNCSSSVRMLTGTSMRPGHGSS